MFKRENLPKAKPKAKKDENKRYRNKIMNFRVTEEEKAKIEKRMALSGLSKQEFFIQSLMNQRVVCIGNVKSFEEIKKQLLLINEHLGCVNTVEELDEEKLESLRMILELFDGLNKLEN